MEKVDAMIETNVKKKIRIEIFPKEKKEQISKAEKNLKLWIQRYCDFEISRIFEVKYFLIELDDSVSCTEITSAFQEIFCDSVIEELWTTETISEIDYLREFHKLGLDQSHLVDVGFRAGVTDNSGKAALDALMIHPAFSHLSENAVQVSSGRCYFVRGDNLSTENLQKIAEEKLANSLLNKIEISTFEDHVKALRFKKIELPKVLMKKPEVKIIDLGVTIDEIQKQNQKNCWALSTKELEQIKYYFNSLKRNPTDVEMEVIAQTWSEHCKHKIFASNISYSEGTLPKGIKSLGNQQINGLFKTFIRGSTLKIKEKRNLNWLISIFHDNAGIVRFDKNVDLCIKVETHNSPSALDPYGGALTGILGVNRDIYGVGVGAKPIANTNVFCLAENKYFKENSIDLPLLLKNPDRIKEGVHLGVQDGGNKSGIPTVNGAFVFHRDFVGKPLVYCGTIGVMPQTENNKSTALKNQKAGDFIVMAGGRIGKDGIHGATFSSMELVDGVPASVVQIGDPITQKRLGDFLIEARMNNLFTSVTDNGAGGLSSSIGEMAQATNGARVFLEKALVKYPGLSPYELMVSESQERMTFSVSKECERDFLELAKKRGVEATIIGEFTSSGLLEVFYENEQVASLSLNFLHESLAPMELNAHYSLSEKEKIQKEKKHWIQKEIKKDLISNKSFKEILLSLLSSPNIRSQEHLVRRYDHEVKGATLIKPFTGEKEIGHMGPSDAGVIWLKPHGGESENAVAISSGLCPKVSEYDTYTMAEYALDEAVRNAVSSGANPDEMVLVDNFCWPDPIESEKNPDGKFKLAELFRANHALHDLSIDYGMPFVSGKDSMKNDFIGKLRTGETVKISVPPTLLITAMGRVPKLQCLTTSEVKAEGLDVYLLGDKLLNHKSAFELPYLYEDYRVEYPLPKIHGGKQLDLYRALHRSMRDQLIESSHDLSDGGLLVALVEKVMSTSFGIRMDVYGGKNSDLLNIFFNEGPGRFLITIKKENQKEFENYFSGHPIWKLGTTTKKREVEVYHNGGVILNVSNVECLNAYRIEANEIEVEG